MISVNEAKSIIQQNVKRLAPVSRPLIEAYGLILAENVFAHADIPAYPQSSMDGYAFTFSERNKTLSITGEMAAGTAEPLTIRANEAARIFTGAPLPYGADTVVMQEKTVTENGQLTIKDTQLKQGVNTRAKGAEIEKGALAMPANTYLSVAAVGFLAGIGIMDVAVFPPPDITIILTGNELQTPGKQLAFGQVYDANSIMLTTALQQAGIKKIQILNAEDNIDSLQSILDKALQQSDMVLLTGGVSVGDYDFVADAARYCGVEKKFHKIKQKPGKPLYFGIKGDKMVFGLPGNPSSALTCFYLYVLPAIESILQKSGDLKLMTGRLNQDYSKASGLTHFLKAKFSEGKVTLLHAQESFRLHSFAQANCLAQLEEDRENYHAGDTVQVHLLPL